MDLGLEQPRDIGELVRRHGLRGSSCLRLDVWRLVGRPRRGRASGWVEVPKLEGIDVVVHFSRPLLQAVQPRPLLVSHAILPAQLGEHALHLSYILPRSVQRARPLWLLLAWYSSERKHEALGELWHQRHLEGHLLAGLHVGKMHRLVVNCYALAVRTHTLHDETLSAHGPARGLLGVWVTRWRRLSRTCRPSLPRRHMR